MGILARRLAALTLSTAVGLGVAEMVVRARVGAPLVERLPLGEVEAHPERGWRMVPGQDHYTYAHEVRVNALGLRGPELPEVRDPDELRVLALGDSTTFGQGVAEEDTLPSAMEATLRELSPERAWRVVNAGHRGYATNQELALLRELGPTIDPDIVLLLWFENDLEDMDISRNHDRYAKTGPVPFDLGEPLEGMAELRWHAVQLLRRSALIMDLHDRLQDSRARRRGEETRRAGLVRADRHLATLAELCAEHGWRGVVAVVPHAGSLSGDTEHEALAAEVRRLAREHGLETLDLYPELLRLTREAGRPPLLAYDGHYDGAANRAMARSAAQQLLGRLDASAR